jgi:hypothetical protein
MKTSPVLKMPCMLRQFPRLPRTAGKRAIIAFATESPQSGLTEVLQAGTVIGSAAYEVLVDEALEVAADASRVQAEQMKILSKLPDDPQGTVNELLQDIQNRGVPSLNDVMQRAASVMVCELLSGAPVFHICGFMLPAFKHRIQQLLLHSSLMLALGSFNVDGNEPRKEK